MSAVNNGGVLVAPQFLADVKALAKLALDPKAPRLRIEAVAEWVKYGAERYLGEQPSPVEVARGVAPACAGGSPKSTVVGSTPTAPATHDRYTCPEEECELCREAGL